MANYSKRDARKAWALEMAANGIPPVDTEPRCHCGKKAVIGFYPGNGTVQFFCEAHEAKTDVLFKRR